MYKRQVKDSAVVNLASVNAKAYGGGFIGHMGKSGAVDIDKVGTGNALEGLLNGTVGVLDVFGSYANNCLVTVSYTHLDVYKRQV